MTQGARIYPDKETTEKLKKIRKENWRIQGKGYAETVRFLANFYLQYGPLERMIKEEVGKIPKAIEDSFQKSLARAINRLIGGE